MKYSITILQAEITRFENGIKAHEEAIKKFTEIIKKKEYPEGVKGEKILKDSINNRKAQITLCEKQITELKADIKKL